MVRICPSCLCRLAEDHARAQVLGDALKALPASCVESVAPVSTNIVIWTLAKPHDPQVGLLTHYISIGHPRSRGMS